MNKKKIEQTIREEFERMIPNKSSPISLKDYVQPQMNESIISTPPPLMRVVLMATLVLLGLVLLPMIMFLPGLIPTTTQSTNQPSSITTTISGSTFTSTTTTSSGSTTTTITTTTTSSGTTITTITTTTTTNSTTTNVVILDMNEVSTQVVTASKLILQMSSSEVLQLANRLNEPILLLDNEIQTINQYVFALEQFIANPDGLETYVQASDREGFVFKIQIQSLLLTGKTQTMWMYYNVLDSATPITIRGILVVQDEDITFEGQMIQEGGEQKWTITSYPNPDDLTTYVRISEKVEGVERKYQILHVNEGTTLYQNEMKFEKSNQEIKIDVRLASINKVIDFNVKRELEEGNYIIKGDYDIQSGVDREVGSFQIDIEENPFNQSSEYVYTVKSGQVEKTYRKDRTKQTNFEGSYNNQKTTL